MESTSNFLSVFYTFKVLQNSIYAELKAWAVVLLYYQRRNSFCKRSSHWYISYASFFEWEVYYSLGIVDIFTCSLLDVNWTFRSDAPPPPHPLEILLLQKSLHSQSHYNLTVCCNTCIICFLVDVVNADFSIQKRKLESVIKGRLVFKELSSCLLFTNVFMISANLRIFGTV